MLNSSWDRVRIAARTLRRQPGFAIVVIASLALAIALNTTMYAMLDALIHPRVDIRDPGSLFRTTYYGDYKHRVKDETRDSLLRIGAPSIAQVAWFNGPSFSLTKPLRSREAQTEGPVARVSVEYLTLMEPRVVAGRLFIPDDEHAEAKPIVLDERLAEKLFTAGVSPIGQRVTVDSTTYTVIGVLSRYAQFPQQHGGFTEFANIQASGYVLGQPQPGEMFNRVVRVRPGATWADLERDLARVSDRIAAAAGEAPTSTAFRVGGTTVEMVRLRAQERALTGAVLLVLLMACANVANMQLARGIGRAKELALRAALGASRQRLIQHLLLESTLLAIGGLVLGLLLTAWFAVALHATIPPAVADMILEPQLGWRVLVFALVATVACIVLIGVLPAIRVSQVDPNQMLKRGAGTGASRAHRRQYGVLVVVELACALVLACASAVTIQSALHIDDDYMMGYDIKPLAMGFVNVKPEPNESHTQAAVFSRVLDRVRGLPGATATAVSEYGQYQNDSVALADENGVRHAIAGGHGYHVVTPDYFRTMGLPILAGRDFREGDENAVILDEYTAKKYWPNASPVGATIRLGGNRSTLPFLRIIGVVGQYDGPGHVRDFNILDGNGATMGAVYTLPTWRDTIHLPAKGSWYQVLVRSEGSAAAVAGAMRRAGGFQAEPMITQTLPARALVRFMSRVFILFAALGLALGAFGVYGVVAHSVAERRRELGVRIAMGATSRDILRAVLRESLVIGLAGIALGLSIVKGSFAPFQAFTVDGAIYGALTFGMIAFGLLCVAAFAAHIPARRATQLDPTEALRND